MARYMAHLSAAAKRAWHLSLDALLPPVCPITDEPVTRHGAVSPEAWAQLTFLAPPWCVCCGLPLPYDAGEGTACGACLATPPAFDGARSALAYDDASRAMILAFKHAGRSDALKTFAAWMAQAGAGQLAEADAVLPTPLHPQRLRKRGFNQAALLARGVAVVSGRAFDPDILARIRRTDTQNDLTAKGRARNVAGAFRVRDAARVRLKGARVVLIDDVYTTGATLNACARALKAAGAARVDALTLARVVRARDASI